MLPELDMKARYLVFFLWLILPLPAFAQDTFTILFLGDSLTEGYGLEEGESFPDMLSDRYAAEGRKNLKIINAGISGSTSASALTRLQWYIRAQPDLLVLSLGANDGLRGLSVDALKANLIKTIEFAQSMDVKVVLTGMLIPPNYGPDYSSAFAQVFPDLAVQYQLTFLPFLLAGVAGITELNQGDGIHPNLEGTKIVADTLYNFLQPLLP